MVDQHKNGGTNGGPKNLHSKRGLGKVLAIICGAALIVVLFIVLNVLWLGDSFERMYNSAARSDLRNATTAQEAHFVDHHTYADSIDDLLGEKYGLRLFDPVVLRVLVSDDHHFKMESYHVEGDKVYSVIGPGGTITETPRPKVKRITSKSVEPLVAALQNKDPHIRLGAVLGLRGLEDDRTIRPLIAALEDKDPNVRLSAAYALRGKKDSSAIEPLITVVEKDEDSNVRRVAAESLMSLDAKRVFYTLFNTLRHEDKQVRRYAALALKTALAVSGDGLDVIKDHTVFDLMIRSLEDEDPVVRRLAVLALGRVKDARTVEPLLKALKDADEIVRKEAVEAITSVEAYITKKDFYMSEGKYDLGISNYSRGIGIKPDDAEAYYRRGQLFAAKHQYDMAISDYSKAIAINPNDAESYRGRAVAYINMGEFNRGQNDFSEAGRIDRSSHIPSIPPIKPGQIKPAPGYIINTGTPAKFGWWLVDVQWVASKFTVDHPGYRVTDIVGYFRPTGSADVIVDITDNAGYTPGATIHYSNRFSVDHEQRADWYGIHGITDLKLPPNDYWVIFRPAKQIDRILEMPKDPPYPAANYAIKVYSGRSTRQWEKADTLNIGIRISGRPVS